MKKITRRQLLGIGAAALGALSIGGLECWHGVSSNKTSLEKRVEKEETGKKVVLDSKFVPTNFGFYGDNVYCTVSRSHGSYEADADREVRLVDGRIIFKAKKPIQFVYPSPKSGKLYVIADKTAKVHNLPLEGFVEEGDEGQEVPLVSPIDDYGGKFYSGKDNLPKEVEERYRLRVELNKTLGNIGINHANQIRVTDTGEVQVVYKQQETGKSPAETNYKLVVETLGRDKLGSLYDKIVGAYKN